MIGYLLRNGAQILQLILFVFFLLSFFIEREALVRRVKWLIGIGFFVLLGWGTLLCVLQYFAWKSSGFGIYLLPPHTPISYFIQYALTNLMSVALLGVAMALVNALVIRIIGRVRPQTLESGDVAITLLCSILVLWPANIFLLPLALLITVLRSLFAKDRVEITFALVFSTFILMTAGEALIHFAKLSTLIIGKW